MAIIKSAKKAIRVDARKWVFNVRRSRALHDTVKEVRDLSIAGEAKDAREKLSSAYKAIDKAAKRGIIKKNTANRKKKRLAALVKKSGK